MPAKSELSGFGPGHRASGWVGGCYGEAIYGQIACLFRVILSGAFAHISVKRCKHELTGTAASPTSHLNAHNALRKHPYKNRHGHLHTWASVGSPSESREILPDATLTRRFPVSYEKVFTAFCVFQS